MGVEGTLGRDKHVGVKGVDFAVDRVQHTGHGYGWQELSSCLVVHYVLAVLDLLYPHLPREDGQLDGEGDPLPSA